MNALRLILTLLLVSKQAIGFIVTRPNAQVCHFSSKKSSMSSVVLFNEKPGSARFTGIQQDDATSGFDLALRAIVSDVGSIVVGLIGLVLAVGYRLAHQDELSTDTLGQETRTDLLAVFACGAVLLNGLSKLDVTSALADSVELVGVSVDQVETYVAEDLLPKDLPWALESILAATPAKTAVALEWDGKVWKSLVGSGILPTSPELRKGPAQDVNPILNRFLKDSSKETYLPTLQAIPGGVEFTYLPPNTQEALLLPISSKQVLVLGSNTAKSFTPRDVAWCQTIASRVGAE